GFRGRGPGKPNSDRAIELLRQLTKDFPKVPDYRLDLCETLARSSGPRRPPNPSSTTKGQERLEEAVTRSEELVAQYPGVPQYTAAHARYLDRLGMMLLQARKLVEAETAHRKAVSLQSGLVKQYPEVIAYGFWLSLMECSLARGLSEGGTLPEARTRLDSAAGRLEALREKEPKLGSIRQSLGMAYRNLAQVFGRSGEAELEALMLRKAESFGRERGPGFGPRDRGDFRP